MSTSTSWSLESDVLSNFMSKSTVSFRRLSLVLALLGITLSFNVGTSSAAGTTAEGLTWTEAGGNVTITGCATGESCNTGALVIPEVIADKPVTAIADYAFDGIGFTSITFPSSIETLGVALFENAGNLTHVSFVSPSALRNLPQYAFQFAVNIQSVVLPEGLVTIEEGALSSQTVLTSIQLPSTLTTIGRSAFYGSGLTSVSISARVETIGDFAFGNTPLASISFPSNSSLTTIGQRAFESTNLTSIAFPSSIETLGVALFENAINLTHVSFVSPSALRTLSSFALQYASTIQSVVLPEGLVTIDDFALSGITALTSVRLPSTLTTIGDRAFLDASSLVSLSIPSSVITIGEYAFSHLGPHARIDFEGDYPNTGSSLYWRDIDDSNTGRVRFQPNTIGWPNPPDEVGAFVTEYFLAAPHAPVATAGVGLATITVVSRASGPTWSRITVTANPGGATCTIVGPSGSCTIAGLTPGTSYVFTASATLDLPEIVSAPSVASNSITPLAPDSERVGAENETLKTAVHTSTTSLPKTGNSLDVMWYAVWVLMGGVMLLALPHRLRRRDHI